jgi:hypothetical protein
MGFHPLNPANEEERYKKGLKTLDPDGGMEESEDERATRGLSIVVHPMIAEAATQFNAKAIAELYPSGGPSDRDCR